MFGHGFVISGLLCHLEDACVSSPCHQGAHCMTDPSFGNYICSCSPGYVGEDCSKDRNECLESKFFMNYE